MSETPKKDELAELAPAVLAGDAKALRVFFTTLVPHLLGVSRRVLGSAHPFVEDVAHDAAYTVVSRLAEYRGEGSVLNFARRVTLLTAMNMRRRDYAQKRARQSAREGVDTDHLLSADPDPESRASNVNVVPLVRELLDDLPESLAEAFGLNILLGYTVAEIAELSSVPVETVRSRLRLAKQRLRSRALQHPVLRDLAKAE